MSAAPPHPSSTLVNVAENAELRLVQLLADSCPSPQAVTPNFQSSCEAAVGNADAAGLIRAILGDSGAIAGLLAVEPTEEAVSAFSLLAALLDRVESEADQSALVAAMAQTITVAPAAGADGGKKKAAMLAALYNLRSSGVEKVDLLARIVTLSAESDPKVLAEGQPLGDVLDAANVKKMTEDWGVGRADQRKLYRAIADGVGKVQGGDSAARRQKFLLSALGTYAEASEVDADALATAKDAAVGAIQDPVTLFAEQRGMLLLPAVAALGNGAATKSLFALLQIFQEGKLEDFESFLKSNEATLAEYGLSKDECTRHMRLLSLCSLASEHEEIPYSAIASTLHVEDTEVETWVIAAVSSGLLSAKMDQLQKVVMVESCVVRKFDIEQWKALQSRLHSWKKNVKSVLDGLEKSQA
eukprot:CAMPEP_0185811978 /NCGR_PEP_ID=MMETSP1322-20130828/8804_1 /TAXON_ID=265543 /ORGANISM="Minutocellus polymorphus, Strain RCC2270" /LENGTH=413 /DNA_ID=CAMNT_0028508481 /DNA_START=214 /DNA_END=1452 /DNA_ORIENTATION=+